MFKKWYKNNLKMRLKALLSDPPTRAPYQVIFYEAVAISSSSACLDGGRGNVLSVMGVKSLFEFYAVPGWSGGAKSMKGFEDINCVTTMITNGFKANNRIVRGGQEKVYGCGADKKKIYEHIFLGLLIWLNMSTKLLTVLIENRQAMFLLLQTMEIYTWGNLYNKDLQRT